MTESEDENDHFPDQPGPINALEAPQLQDNPGSLNSKLRLLKPKTKIK